MGGREVGEQRTARPAQRKSSVRLSYKGVATPLQGAQDLLNLTNLNSKGVVTPSKMAFDHDFGIVREVGHELGGEGGVCRAVGVREVCEKRAMRVASPTPHPLYVSIL